MSTEPLCLTKSRMMMVVVGGGGGGGGGGRQRNCFHDQSHGIDTDWLNTT